MKTAILISIILFIFTFIFLEPVESSTGIGFIIGEPTGLSLRIDRFPVIGIAWSINNYFHLHCDYWLITPHIKRGLYWFWGFGGKMTSNKTDSNNLTLGMRVPIGLRYFPSKKIEVFFEVAPGLRVFPDTASDFDIGLGMRFIL